MRTRTPPTFWADDEGREHRTMTVQRCCNGCGHEIGDVTEGEIAAAIGGAPLSDVRDECPWCVLTLTESERASDGDA